MCRSALKSARTATPKTTCSPFVLVLSVNILLLTLKGQQHAEEQVHGPQNVQALNEKFS